MTVLMFFPMTPKTTIATMDVFHFVPIYELCLLNVILEILFRLMKTGKFTVCERKRYVSGNQLIV